MIRTYRPSLTNYTIHLVLDKSTILLEKTQYVVEVPFTSSKNGGDKKEWMHCDVKI